MAGKRRERPYQLIELGDIVAETDLMALTGDNRAFILWLLVAAATRLRGDDREQWVLPCRRRGRRAIDNDQPAQS